jgi:hypothetical protein
MSLSIITVIAAACGSLVSGLATVVTTWITQRTNATHAQREARLRVCEALYGEFITEASRLTIEALSQSLEKPDTFMHLYGILGRIRLMAADPILAAAEECTHQLVDLYTKPNMSIEQIRVAFERDRLDPIREFSATCRKELLQLAIETRG